MADKEAKSTTRKLVTNDQANYYSRITIIMVNGKNAYELKEKFLDDLQKMPLVDPTNRKVQHWLALKFVNYKTMDIFTEGTLWDYWKLGSDEIKPMNDETSDLEETDHDDE
nr:hypothetical protein [Tanacetum cinerariifolium]